MQTLKIKQQPALLQRITTQNIGTKAIMLSCICNHFGKVQSRFWIHSDQAYTYLHIEKENMPKLISQIKHYDLHQELDLSNIYECDIKQLGFKFFSPLKLQLIQKKIITLHEDIANKYTPHVLGLVDHHAVSFQKGCYVGHEPIARTEFRGSIKKKLQYKSAPTLLIEAVNHFFDGEAYHMLVIDRI